MKSRLVAGLCLAGLLAALGGCGSTPTPAGTPLPTKTLAPTLTPVSQPLTTPDPATPTASVATAPTASTTPTPAPARTAAPQATPTPLPSRVPRMQSPEYGVQVFLWWQPMTTDRDLKLAKDAGFSWIKQNFSWVDMEGAKKGALDWTESDRIVAKAAQYGLDIIARVDKAPGWASKGAAKNQPMANYGDYGDFVAAMAARYKGKIRAYEIWNEPNLGREWGSQADAVEYVKLLKVAYERIIQADPKATIISAGLSPTTSWGENVPDEDFLKRMYVSGARPYFDVLGAHAAGYKAPPETDPADLVNGKANQYCAWGTECARIYVFRHLEDLRKIMVDNSDGSKQVAVVEFGWDSDNRTDSVYKWHYVSEDVKADYIVRAFQYAKGNWAPWIGAMTVIYIPKADWTIQNEEYWWSITNPDGTPRPAYTKFKQWRTSPGQ
jgi:polysaccharide biosynthesis protein PslG